jgi:hypothetical protein
LDGSYPYTYSNNARYAYNRQDLIKYLHSATSYFKITALIIKGQGFFLIRGFLKLPVFIIAFPWYTHHKEKYDEI